MAQPEPKRSPLRRILEHPGGRQRVGRAIVSLMEVGIASLIVLGLLLIWHSIHRGRLIRERLNPPRPVKMPDFDPEPGES